MADSNAVILDDLLPIDTPLSSRDEAAFYRVARDRAEYFLRTQIRKGVGRDGKKLKRVQPKSRPDHATGEPLDPHYGESRSVKWLRSAARKTKRGISLYWSHGWGRILGYHADGAGRFGPVPVRDIRGLTRANERRLRSELSRWARSRSGRRRYPPGPRVEIEDEAPKPVAGPRARAIPKAAVATVRKPAAVASVQAKRFAKEVAIANAEAAKIDVEAATFASPAAKAAFVKAVKDKRIISITRGVKAATSGPFARKKGR